VPVDGEGRIGGEEGGVLDEVLGELYIFLMKESNMMLNIAYTNTVIERYGNSSTSSPYILGPDSVTDS
jgi:hypothetical protein